MKNDIKEQTLIDFTKRTLDHDIQNLDRHTRSRLQFARTTVLSQTSQPRSWVPQAWAMTAACLVIFLIALWNINSQKITSPLPFEDVEILASADGWEFYEDLEFYSWLTEDDQTG